MQCPKVLNEITSSGKQQNHPLHIRDLPSVRYRCDGFWNASKQNALHLPLFVKVFPGKNYLETLPVIHWQMFHEPSESGMVLG